MVVERFVFFFFFLFFLGFSDTDGNEWRKWGFTCGTYISETSLRYLRYLTLPIQDTNPNGFKSIPCCLLMMPSTTLDNATVSRADQTLWRQQQILLRPIATMP